MINDKLIKRKAKNLSSIIYHLSLFLFTKSWVRKHPIKFKELYSFFIIAERWKISIELVDKSFKFSETISIVCIYLIDIRKLHDCDLDHIESILGCKRFIFS